MSRLADEAAAIRAYLPRGVNGVAAHQAPRAGIIKTLRGAVAGRCQVECEAADDRCDQQGPNPPEPPQTDALRDGSAAGDIRPVDVGYEEKK